MTFVTVLTALIEKVFLQISINPNDRDYLRFLWFEYVFAEVSKIVRNRFARVLFSMTSSPYLLNSTVPKHAKTYDFGFEFINKVVNCFYIDTSLAEKTCSKSFWILLKKIKFRFMEGFVCMGFFVKVEDNDEKLHHLINENDDEMKKMIHLVLICRIL